MSAAARALRRTMLHALRTQSGMSIVETMVAAVILSAGVLGVFVMVETADRVNAESRGRTTATAITRELLEDARSTSFQTIGANKWFEATLKAIPGGSGVVTSSGTTTPQRTTVTRDKATYQVAVDTCTVDDGKDGYGAHSASLAWCTDSASTGVADSQPQDMKRVAITMNWTSPNGRAETLYQTATIGSTGQLIGPTLTDLQITKPTGVDQANPVIASNPTDPAGIVRFLGTSAGAANMKWFVDGAEVQTGISGGGGSWTLDWNITNVADGTYQISAVAVDALGTRGAPRIMNVKLARSVPTAPANVTGGYNDVYAAGSKTRVVELMWDASPEGSVTGYDVSRGTTLVCAASLKTECMDLNAPQSGTTTYTVRTLYVDGAGNPGSVSTNYVVTAPSGGSSTWPTVWSLVNSNTNNDPACWGGGTNSHTLQDLSPTRASGTTKIWTNAAVSSDSWMWACLPPFPSSGYSMSAGQAKLEIWLKNGADQCGFYWYVMLYPGSIFLTGTSQMAFMVPQNAGPTKYTLTLPVSARTFSATDRISLYAKGRAATKKSGTCQSIDWYYNSSTYDTTLTLPISGPSGGGGSGSIARPATPTGLSATANGDGTTTLTWTPPSGTPAVEFYRIYRDGQNYTERFDTAGHTGDATLSWTDTNTGGTSHTYRVTAVSNVLAESDPAGPVTQ